VAVQEATGALPETGWASHHCTKLSPRSLMVAQPLCYRTSIQALVPLVCAVATRIGQRFERLIEFQPVPYLARVDWLRFGHAAILDHLIEQRRRDAYNCAASTRDKPRGGSDGGRILFFNQILQSIL
jgi:hypothetical protein